MRERKGRDWGRESVWGGGCTQKEKRKTERKRSGGMERRESGRKQKER